MRVSVNKDDCGYVANHYNIEILLNGVRVKDCITADEELGEIIKYKTDDKGYIFDYTTGTAETEVLTGVVQIVVPDGWMPFY